MKNKSILFIFGLVIVIIIAAMAAFAQQPNSTQKDNSKQQQTKIDPQNMQHGYRFVDKDGDGYNDNAPDHDGDGIPNGVDPDYQGPKNRKGGRTRNFVDKNGDGINDLAGQRSGFRGRGRHAGFGGKGGAGYRTGVCDGTGPKGAGRNQNVK